MRTSDPTHLHYVRQGEFPFRCDPRLFSDEEHALITRWGHWYDALSSGQVTAITPAQEAFIEAVKGDAPPAEPHAAAWWRYGKRLAIEERHGTAMHSSYQVDSDTFYSRDMAKQLRKTMGGVTLREHKRG
jgi:uncharacterized protein YifE (UPF0438 family)